MSLAALSNQKEMLMESACFCSQKDEPDAFKELGTGNRIATWLFYVSDTFLPSVTAYSIPWNDLILLFFHCFLLKGHASEAATNFGVIHIWGGSSCPDFAVLPCVLRSFFPPNLSISLNYLPAYLFLYLHQCLQHVHCLNTQVGGLRLGLHWEQRGFGLLRGFTSTLNFTFTKK